MIDHTGAPATPLKTSPRPWSENKKGQAAAFAKVDDLCPVLSANDKARQAAFLTDQQVAAKAQQNPTAMPAQQPSMQSTQQQAVGTTALTPVEPIMPLWSVASAQSSSMTIAGAGNRFIFVRLLQGKPRVVDLQNLRGAPITLPDFKFSFAVKVDLGNGSTAKVCDLLENEVLNRSSSSVAGSASQQHRFIIVDDLLLDPRLPIGKTTTAEGREIFNLFLGLDVEKFQPMDNPAAHCPNIMDYVHKVLAYLDTDPDQFIFNWMAWCVQNIGEKSGVAVVIRGLKGTGKSTQNRIMHGLFSPHSFVTDKASDLFGRFNGHLQDELFVGVDEALWAADGQEADRAKALITDPMLALERKYKDSKQARTYMNVGMTTNHDHAAPATGDERRYAIFDMNTKGLLTAAQWEQLHTVDLERGSVALGAFYQVLMNHDLQGWVPRDNIPQNAALSSVKEENLAGSVGYMMQWMLESDELPWQPDGADWDVSPVMIMGKHQKDLLRGAVRNWHQHLLKYERKNKLKKLPSDHMIANALRDQFGAAMDVRGGQNGAEKGWQIPNRKTCEANWRKANGL